MIINSRPTISREEIISEVTEADILGHYIGINSVPCLINSPLREDSKPSFALYSPDGKSINYIDFSNGDRGGCMTLLMKLWNVDRPQVYSRIQKDLLSFSNNSVSCKESSNIYRVTINRDPCELQCKIRSWEPHDIEYWESFGVTLKWLKYCDVYPVSHKFITKGSKTFTFKADKYAYVFVERKDGRVTIKLYQPFNTNGFKWQNNHTKDVLGLWTKIPQTGDKVCVCSSVKDALCLMCNLHIPCICLQGEAMPLSSTVITELKQRFKTCFICLDNDEAGTRDSKKLEKETGFTNIIIPKNAGGKDISDVYKALGKDNFKKLFIKLFTTSNLSYDWDELPFEC